MSTNDPMTQERLAEARTTLDDDMSQWGGEYGLELIAEVERLRALTTVDKEMIERGARAYFEYPIPGVDAAHRMSWERLAKTSPHNAADYRDGIRAVLGAALDAGEDA